MFSKKLTVVLQKKQTAAGYMASAGKVGNEEKWAHAAMEYIYEKKHVNDGNKKKQQDVQLERRLAAAFDRYNDANEKQFERRLSRLNARMTEALEAIRELDLQAAALAAQEASKIESTPPEHDENSHNNNNNHPNASTLIEECVLLNAEQPPGNFQRPSLSPPLTGYEPGYALDVPQLRSQQAEYPPIHRPTDAIQFSSAGGDLAAQSAASSHHHNSLLDDDSSDAAFSARNAEHVNYHQFPYVETYALEDLTVRCERQLTAQHGALRQQAPLTGAEGEGWEAYVALQRRALRRQRLLLDLAQQSDLAERYEKDENGFRAAELARRGLLPLRVEGEAQEEGGEGHSANKNAKKNKNKKSIYNNFEENYHFAQVPAYEPFRAY